MSNNNGWKKFFKNGYIKTFIGLLVGIILTTVCAYALQGMNTFSKEEAREEFVEEDVYTKDMDKVYYILEDVDDTLEEMQKDIKELLKK